MKKHQLNPGLFLLLFFSITSYTQPSFFLPSDQWVTPDQNICLPMKVMDFTDIAEMDFQVNWDSTVLELDTTYLGDLPFLEMDDFDYSNISSGELQLIWDAVDCSTINGGAVTINDFTEIFELCFNVIGEPGDTTSLTLSDGIVPLFITRTNISCNNIGYLETTGFVTVFPADTIVGPTTSCPSATETYEIPYDSCYIFNEFEWEITPPIMGSIVSTDQFPGIFVQWDNVGVAQLCVTPTDTCNTAITSCISVTVEPLPQTQKEVTLCFGESFFYAGDIINSPGVYPYTFTSFQGCDSIVNCIVDILPPEITVLDITSCGCFSFGDTTVCETGFYEQTLFNATVNGCDSIINVNYTSTNSADLIEYITPDTFVCFPSEIQLLVEAPEAVSIQWVPAAQLSCVDCPDPIAFPPYSMEYIVFVEDAEGCTDEASVFITVPFGLDWGLISWSNSPICEGEDLMFFGQDVPVPNVAEWHWTGPGGFESFDPNPIIQNVQEENAGTYTVTITDINGCSAEANFDVFVNTLELVAVTSDVSCPGESTEICFPNDNGEIYTITTPSGVIITDNCIEIPSPVSDYSGEYCVSYINADGCESPVNCVNIVFPNPVEISVFADTFICPEESQFFFVDVIGGIAPYEYLWETTIPTTVIDNPSSPNPEIQISETGLIELTIIDGNGCTSLHDIFVEVDSTCVWPGDTDLDKVVNNFDLLNIGIAFDSTGPIRPSASLDWVPQQASDWTQNTPSTNVNFKHIDTDGNGVINSDDTLAITQNWGLMHNLWGVDDRTTGTPFYVEPDTFVENTTYALPIILGDLDFPAEDVYGIAFTINIDSSILASQASVNFEDSWLGNSTEDMINIQKTTLEPMGGKVDIGITRIDGQNRSGYGQLGLFYITIEDIIFQMPSGGGTSELEKELIFEIDNVRIINFEEEEIPVDLDPKPSLATGLFSGDLSQYLEVFPNPSNGIFNIQSLGVQMQQIDVYSIAGRHILSKTVDVFSDQIDLSEFDRGAYLLKIKSTEGLIVLKVLKP